MISLAVFLLIVVYQRLKFINKNSNSYCIQIFSSISIQVPNNQGESSGIWGLFQAATNENLLSSSALKFNIDSMCLVDFMTYPVVWYKIM